MSQLAAKLSTNYPETHKAVIPASEARRESFSEAIRKIPAKPE